MKRILPILFILFFMAACASPQTGSEPVTVTHSYPATDVNILNPERGFFTPYDLPASAGFSPVRVTGNALVHLNIRLDDWRESDIPQEILDGLDQNFGDIRDSGLKAIFRVAYNQGPYPDSEPDASKAQILRHIEQLKPLLLKNGDVIAWAEAGFIGAWGEWHTSTNGLDNITDKRDILNALLSAMPENRMAQVRYPANLIEMYPDPMNAVNARVAHHNDCFLSSTTDVGTYERDGENTIIRDQTYLAELTRFTPMSGETCAPFPPRSECESAIREMELLHFSAINEAYHKGILRSWEEGGCMEEIENRLGYRLSLKSADFNEQARPGGLLNLKVSLTNSGFASLMNPRPVLVVLKQTNSLFLTKLDLDPRQWQPGTSSFALKLRLPSNIGEGRYDLALWLPDEAETIQNDSRYAVRFANENVWDDETGYNVLGKINIDNSSAGSVRKTEFLTVEEITSEPAIDLPKSTPTPTLEPTIPMPVDEVISNPQISNDAEILKIQFTFISPAEGYNGFQVFLDTDQNLSTGYSINGIGADYLLENESLNQYSGEGNNWDWSPTGNDIPLENSNHVVRWSFDTSNIGKPTAIDYVCQLVNSSWDAVFSTSKQTYSLK